MEIYIAVAEEPNPTESELRRGLYAHAYGVTLQEGKRERAQAGYLARSTRWKATMAAAQAGAEMIGKAKPDQEVRIRLSVAGMYLPHTARRIAEDPGYKGPEELLQLVRGIMEKAPQAEFLKADPQIMREPGWQRAMGAAQAALGLRDSPARRPELPETAPEFRESTWETDLTLAYYDGPRAMLRRDRDGTWYLALWHDSDREGDDWIYIPASPQRLREIFSGERTLPEALENPEGPALIHVRERNDLRMETKAVTARDLDQDSLPMEGAELELAAPSELDDL